MVLSVVSCGSRGLAIADLGADVAEEVLRERKPSAFDTQQCDCATNVEGLLDCLDLGLRAWLQVHLGAPEVVEESQPELPCRIVLQCLL